MWYRSTMGTNKLHLFVPYEDFFLNELIQKKSSANTAQLEPTLIHNVI